MLRKFLVLRKLKKRRKKVLSSQVEDVVGTADGSTLISLFELAVICLLSCFFRLAESYSLLVEHLLNKCVKVDKRLCWQVMEIDWTGYVIITIESSHHLYLL